MPALVDTSIRLLSQEPLAQRVQSSQVLQLAEILDGAGFEYLEVSGGGCFDSAVRRGVESPWERIRAIRARCKTPLGMALRGRLLVGSRPLSRDLVTRFVASAASSGIDVFRIHDPLNDLANLREAAEAIRAAEKELTVGLVHSPGPGGETEVLLERAHALTELGATRALVHDPSGSLDPAQAVLSAYPEVARSGIHAAALLGDDEAVRRFLASDPLQATAPGGPRGWDPLTCLCFSKFLRLDPPRSPAFLRAAQALLDAGASAATGFFAQTHQPNPEFESALYGAAGVAHHAGLTRLLLDRGADAGQM